MNLLLDAPVNPTPGQGRSWLQHELAHREYHDLKFVQLLLRWLSRIGDFHLATGGGFSWVRLLAIMLVLAALVLGIAMLVSRARRNPSRAKGRTGDVITEEAIDAAGLRARAEAAYAAGDHVSALVDGFRALARRQVERGRLPDDPSLTADEVARGLEREWPALEGRAVDAATSFDGVLYGGRPASAELARGVLDLEQELAVAR